MRIPILTTATALGLLLLNSCGLTNDREAKVHDYLKERVTSESQGALKLDKFKKTNGYDQNILEIKGYIIEWQADISIQQEIWKEGNFLAGYWSNFGVRTKQPGSMEEMMKASSSKHFNAGAKIRLTGDSYLQKTEKGWRVEELSVNTTQILAEGSASINSNNNDIENQSVPPNSNQPSNNNTSLTNTNHENYKGAWFEIWIPKNFIVIPSLKSTTSSEGYESAFFRSPDKKVEFYIFSPQWSGEPTDISINSETEKQIASESKTSGNNIVTWFTIKANDGSYTRAYQDIKAKDGSTRYVFGIKYSDQSSYEAYKDDYLMFKKSLRQFAD